MYRTLRIIIAVVAAWAVGTPLAAQRSGYAWADQPTSDRYTPDARYAFSSVGEPITIRRLAVGRYEVTFAGLADGSRPGGHVQVTSYGPENDACKVERWASEAGDLKAYVRCFDARGRATDARYNISATGSRPVVRGGIRRPDVTLPSTVVERRWVNGHVEVVRADGTVTIECPVGTPLEGPSGWICAVPMSTNVQYGNLPPLPTAPRNGSVNAWIRDQEDRLMEIVTRHLEAGEVSEFSEAEARLNSYQRIDWRVRFLDFLLREGTGGDQ